MNKKVEDVLLSLALGGICAGTWIIIIWLIVKFTPSSLWGFVALPLVAGAYWMHLQGKPVEKEIENKYLKRILLFGLSSIMGGVLALIITYGISLLLVERGIITIHKVPSFSISSVWINWELHIIFTFVFAGMVWLVYQLNFRERKEVKDE